MFETFQLVFATDHPGLSVGVPREVVDQELVGLVLRVRLLCGLVRVVRHREVAPEVGEHAELVAGLVVVVGVVRPQELGVVLRDPMDRPAATTGRGIRVLDLPRRIGRDLDRVRIVRGLERDRPIDPSVTDPALVEEAQGLIQDPVVRAVAVAPVRPAGDGRDRAREREQRGQREGGETLGTDSAAHGLLGPGCSSSGSSRERGAPYPRRMGYFRLPFVLYARKHR